MTNEIVVLNRDTMALLVPAGAPMMLPKGTEVKITQSLGSSFTVNVYGNLARIDAKDADALGREIHNPLDDLPEAASVKDKVWAQLHSVYDPEIPVNIVDLGLVYDCEIEKLNDDTHRVNVVMTLTAPGCGMGPVIAEDAKIKLLDVPEVSDAHIDIVFDPPWDRSMMSDVAKLQLGMM
ncbi:putative Fe-S cluster assembly protein SufT [Candidiatus Paracoxiella cheracis]|uniref:putative Fe-S cluster assembly protein SufT n=1 Tax=Candidiatus Paracoxiella cheracis TaxID=3405120 RepID=UPI003BF4A53B